MARREWDDHNVRVSHNSDGSISIINEHARVDYTIPHEFNKTIR